MDTNIPPLEQQYREAETGDHIAVPSENSPIPLWAGEVWKVAYGDDGKEVHFGDAGHYLLEKDGQIGVFR